MPSGFSSAYVGASDLNSVHLRLPLVPRTSAPGLKRCCSDSHEGQPVLGRIRFADWPFAYCFLLQHGTRSGSDSSLCGCSADRLCAGRLVAQSASVANGGPEK